jgi:hypothetical protein
MLLSPCSPRKLRGCTAVSLAHEDNTMPTLIIKTNADLTGIDRPSLLQTASKTVATMLGKPMRTSQFPLQTVKETPADAEIASHRLMLRAGMIRKLAAGLYTWLPLGLRVLRKVERIVREEMDRAGALEVSMPAVQPAELWQESGRWEQYGPELLRIRDRHQREFCFGPTHEEIITDLARGELRSYKQLPINFYQIQTKFRDEIRPRFGVMRAREFLMKDAYSFHVDQASLAETYRSCTRPTAASSAAAGSTSAPCRRTPAASAATPPTSSMCWRTPARTPSPSPPAATMPPTSSWPRRWRRPTRRGAGRGGCAWSTRRTPRPSPTWSSSSASPSSARSRPWWWPRDPETGEEAA